MYRYLLKNLKNADDASDLTQDAFERLWINHQKVEFPKAKAWLFTTAHNAFINFLKKQGRQTSLDEHTSISSPVSSSGKRMEAKEILEICLDRLPEQQRAIILLRDLEGYNYAEIGEIMGLNESQVKVYLFRARQKIKNWIKDTSF